MLQQACLHPPQCQSRCQSCPTPEVGCVGLSEEGLAAGQGLSGAGQVWRSGERDTIAAEGHSGQLGEWACGRVNL